MLEIEYLNLTDQNIYLFQNWNSNLKLKRGHSFTSTNQKSMREGGDKRKMQKKITFRNKFQF